PAGAGRLPARERGVGAGPVRVGRGDRRPVPGRRADRGPRLLPRPAGDVRRRRGRAPGRLAFLARARPVAAGPSGLGVGQHRRPGECPDRAGGREFGRGMLAGLTLTLGEWYDVAGRALAAWLVERVTIPDVPGLSFAVSAPPRLPDGTSLPRRQG